MKNETFCKIIGRRLYALFCAVLCLFCILVCLVGCRSSRNTVEETYREVHASVREVSEIDTVRYTASANEEQRDSAEVKARERTVIRLKRDSAGRVVEIRTERNAKINANGSRQAGRDLRIYGLSKTFRSETTDSVAAIDKKKEEIKKETKGGVCLECIIGWSLVSFVILFYVVDYIYRVWKKRQGK